MDYHFYEAKTQEFKVNLSRLLLAFFPLFVLSFLLPVLLGLVQNPVTVKTDANASQNDLSIWIEPANVIVDKGTPVQFTLKAHFDGQGKLLPGVVVPVHTDGIASIEGVSVEYKLPFSGQVTLGTVTVTPQKTGTFRVFINPSEVVSPSSQIKPLVFVSEATLVTR